MVRNVLSKLELEDDLADKLEQRARRHGRSVEAELREVIQDLPAEGEHAPAPESPGLGTRMAARFRGIGLKEGEEIQELRGMQLRPLFSFDDDAVEDDKSE